MRSRKFTSLLEQVENESDLMGISSVDLDYEMVVIRLKGRRTFKVERKKEF